MKIYDMIQYSLNDDLIASNNKETFDKKTTMLLNNFMDMAIQGFGWAA